MAKADLGVQLADKEFLALEKEIQKVYREASVDIQNQMDAFYTRFRKKDEAWQKRFKELEGDELKQAKSEYQKWLKGQVFQGKQWQAKKESINNTLSHYNEVALNMVNNRVPNVFQINANYSAYQMEHTKGIDFGFNLYNPSTVEKLIKEQADILPYKKLNKAVDKQWNFQNIKREIAKGIIEGESITKISKRLSTVIPDRSKSMLTTHARTMVTSAQNQGRLARFEEAEEKGIEMEKEWLATLDGRTRLTHQELDGQRKPLDEPFEVEGMEIMFPADPHAHPSLVYNCRCTMNSYIKKYPPQYTTRRDQTTGELISNMSYKEWLQWKEGS